MNKLNTLGILILFLSLTNVTHGSGEGGFDFEAELRALETESMKEEELQMNLADAVTDVISDEVNSSQASVARDTNELSSKITLPQIDPSTFDKPLPSINPRRIRSR